MPRRILADGKTYIVPDDATPDEINQIVGTSPGYKPPVQAPGALEPHGGPLDFFRGAGSGIVNTVMHPVQTIESMGQPFVAAGASVGGGYPGTVPLVGKVGREATAQNEQARQAAREGQTAQGEFAAQHPAFTAGSIAGPALIGAGAERLFPRVVPPAFRAGLESARKSGQSMVGAGEKPIRAQVAKEGEAAQAGYIRSQQASAKNTEDTLRERAETKSSRLKALTKTRADQNAHAAKLGETKAANAEALRKQGKIEPTQAKLRAASENLRARVETARENALKVGNEKYSAVNKQLNPLPADMEKINALYSDAADFMGGTQSEPAIITRLGKALERGEVLTYKDEQALYSELGKELSKGNLPGSTYHVYDQMHEAIGEDMQRIADTQGTGEQLTEARNYWRRMKQTFGKPYNPTDAATLTMEKSSPDFARQEQQATRLNLLGAFDPEILKVVENITNLRKGVSALGEPKPVREVVKPLPSEPETKTLPDYSEPKGSVPYERPEVSTRAIREHLLDRWTSGESQLSKFQVRSLLGGGFGAIAGYLLGEGHGATIGGIGGSVFGPAIIARILEMPSVREWLTRPPAEELDMLRKLPSADRLKLTDGLKKIVPEAQSQGVRVSPLVLAALGAGSQNRPKHPRFSALSPVQ